MIYPESPLTVYEYFELVYGCVFVILFLRILVWLKKILLIFHLITSIFQLSNSQFIYF